MKPTASIWPMVGPPAGMTNIWADHRSVFGATVPDDQPRLVSAPLKLVGSGRPGLKITVCWARAGAAAAARPAAIARHRERFIRDPPLRGDRKLTTAAPHA